MHPLKPLEIQLLMKLNEVKSISDWANENRMILNFSKTWKIVTSKGSLKQLPSPIDGIRRKKWIKLLGFKFQDGPCCWDLHVDELLSKASGRMYILRVCKSYGYPSLSEMDYFYDYLYQ